MGVKQSEDFGTAAALQERPLTSPREAPSDAEADWTDFDLIVEPTRKWRALDLGEVWAYRELLYFLAWRDIKVRHKKTLLGALWSVAQPVFTMIVFTVFFGKLAGIEEHVPNVPYSLFALTGLVPWTFFAQGALRASDSLVRDANLITKVYFPRMIIPLAGLVAGLVDFAIAFTILLGVTCSYGFWPTWRVAALLPLLLLACSTALAVGLWLSALSVRLRDLRHTLGFAVQLWMYATPIAYPSTLLGDKWLFLYGINPMVGVVDGFRWSLLGTEPPRSTIWLGALVTSVALATGALYFRRVERTFADTV